MKFKMHFGGGLLLLLGMALALKAGAVNHLVVQTKDDQHLHFLVRTNPHCYFTDNAVVIRLDAGEQRGMEYSYPLDNFSRLYYKVSDSELTGTESIEAAGPTFCFTSTEVVATGLPAHSAMTLYTVAGMLAAEATVSESGECTINIAGLSAGTYIVKTATTTYKILKR